MECAGAELSAAFPETLEQFVEAGDYEVDQVILEDWAGMHRTYDRGNTDFSQIFGAGTKITVKP